MKWSIFKSKPRASDFVHAELSKRGWVAASNATKQSMLYTHPAFPGHQIKVDESGKWWHMDDKGTFIIRGMGEPDISSYLAFLAERRVGGEHL